MGRSPVAATLLWCELLSDHHPHHWPTTVGLGRVLAIARPRGPLVQDWDRNEWVS